MTKNEILICARNILSIMPSDTIDYEAIKTIKEISNLIKKFAYERAIPIIKKTIDNNYLSATEIWVKSRTELGSFYNFSYDEIELLLNTDMSNEISRMKLPNGEIKYGIVQN